TVTNTGAGADWKKWEGRLDYCPFVGHADDEEPPYYPSDECSTSWAPYCEPTDSTGPILPSPTNIPQSCYPQNVTKTPSVTTPNGPTGPTPPSTPKNCNAWRLVKRGG